DDLLAGAAQKREVFEVRPDLASRIRLDSYCRRRIRDRQRRERGAHKRSNPHESPLSSVLSPRCIYGTDTPCGTSTSTKFCSDCGARGTAGRQNPILPETGEAPPVGQRKCRRIKVLRPVSRCLAP